MQTELNGSCLCGAVKYSLKSEPQMAFNCHCRTCRKMTGSAFEAVVLIDEAGFKIGQGEDCLTVYQISRKARKHFCNRCGTPIYNRHRLAPGKVIVHIGSLDDPARIKPSVNLHAQDMLPWVTAIGEMETFERGFER